MTPGFALPCLDMPDAAFDTLRYWRRRTHQLREGLLRRIDDLSASDYPEASASYIIEFLLAFFDELGVRIDKATSEQELRFISQLIQSSGIFLQWLDNAHTAQTPRALALLLKELMDRMQPQSVVLVVPQAEYNYGINDLGPKLRWFVEEFIPHSRQGRFDKFVNTPLKLIAFPRIERDNLIAHAIFGHELGHPIADAFLEWEPSQAEGQKAQVEANEKVAKLVEALLKSKPELADRQLEISVRALDLVLEIRNRAIQELVSDAVGIYIFGPSALFAMHELLWHGDWDQPPRGPQWYPPSRMRLRLMLQVLDEKNSLEALTSCKGEIAEKYMPEVAAFVEHSRSIAEQTTDQSALGTEPELTIAYEWVVASLPAALKFAAQKSDAVLYDISAAQKQLPELLERIELGVPPNEVGDPLKPDTVDLRSPLLASWVYKTRGLDARTGQPLGLKEIDKLNLQTLLAVEYVLLRRKYEEHAKASEEIK